MFITTLKSYAKINIGLRITKKRHDGFHDLETIFYPVKLHDEILIKIEPSFSNTNSIILKINKPYIPLTKDNLCYKAVENFFKAFKIKDCYRISLDVKKYIPVGGGLGGGSSNAATLLKFLVKYFKIDIKENRKKLLETALSIGSDVPFFLVHKPCYAEGRGEKLSILNDFFLDFNILIVNPNLHVSTKWAFKALNLQTNFEAELVLKNLEKFDIKKKNLFINSFEEIVFEKYNILKDIKDDLQKRGAVYSSMSGSGATMYGFFEKNNNDALNACQKYYQEKKYFTFISD